MQTLTVHNMEVGVRGRLVRIAGLKAELYEHLADPQDFIGRLKTAGIPADLFTFVQTVSDRTPHYNYHLGWESIAVMNITTYDNWWKKQISAKTRNMIRKAEKSGVEVRTVEFGDELVRGIQKIYNESPLRQGKRFWHYGKDLETLKRDHVSYIERSDFIGAFLQNELIGFIKLVHGDGLSHLMQIISMTAHRDKAPTNALIARAVEICAQRNVTHLHYGMWSRRGLGEF